MKTLWLSLVLWMGCGTSPSNESMADVCFCPSVPVVDLTMSPAISCTPCALTPGPAGASEQAPFTSPTLVRTTLYQQSQAIAWGSISVTAGKITNVFGAGIQAVTYLSPGLTNIKVQFASSYYTNLVPIVSPGPGDGNTVGLCNAYTLSNDGFNVACYKSSATSSTLYVGDVNYTFIAYGDN